MMHGLATAFFSAILLGCTWQIVKVFVDAKRDYNKMMDDLDRVGKDDD
jgi:hypothetical protein